MEKEYKELMELYNSVENKRSILNTLRAEKYKHLVKYVNGKFPLLSDKKYSLGMKLYWLFNDINDFPKCIECGHPNKTHRCYIDGYATEYCSKKCSSGKIRQSKMEKTYIERYGVNNPLKNSDILEKQQKTIKEKYGVENIFQHQATIQKIAQTKLEKYGDEHYTNREKMIETNKERYGVENPFESSIFQEKAKQTLLNKYGVTSPMQIKEVYKSVTKKSKQYHIHNSYTNFLSKNPFSEPAFDEEFYYSHSGLKREFDFKCRKCGKIYKSKIRGGTIRRCPNCYSAVTTSIDEQDLYDFILSIYKGTIIRKDRTVLNGRELDLFIPDKKLAIEFDGLYWHSELNLSDNSYHLRKTIECENKGIQLLHIFSDEWINHNEIVKSTIMDLLDIYHHKINSNDCKIVDVDSSVEMEFLEQNHIQGRIRSSYCYGLEHNGELVALMSFSKPRIALGRKGREGEYELLRFCSKLGYQVIGGAGKLLKHFEKNVKPSNLVSYADRRWSVGKVYKSLGFDLSHISPPNYWYLNNGCYERFHRFTFRKSVLKNKLKKFDENLTEAENMRRNKYTRIWDCGNLVFVKQYKKDEE